MAPTVPQVPVPVMADGYGGQTAGGPRARFIDRFGCGADRSQEGDGNGCGPRLFGRLSGLCLFGKGNADYEPYDPYTRKPRWCSDCAPAVRQPLPALPANAGFGTYEQVYGAGRVRSGGTCTSGTCSTGACATETGGGLGVGHCWHKFVGWLCYRQTPVHMPCTPNPRMPPTYTYFPCSDRAGCASGNCGATGCGIAGCNTGGMVGQATRGGAFAARGPDGRCLSCPQAGEAIMPGYRLATPEAGVADGQPAVGPVTTTSYRAPGTAKPAGQPAPGTYPTVRPFPQQ